MAQPRLFLIDSFGFIFRPTTPALARCAADAHRYRGFHRSDLHFQQHAPEADEDIQAPYIAAVFESTGPTLREQEFAEYKANRTEMPPDLGEQIPYIRRLIEAMRIPILEYPRF